MLKRMPLLCVPLLLCACGAQPPSSPATDPAPAAEPVAATPDTSAQPAPTRPMDEVPTQKAAANGEREYHFANGCVVVLEAKRAVVTREGPQCASHHRDIALLYASAD